MKKDGFLRLCVDYRGLSSITTTNRYPLPLASDFMKMLADLSWSIKVDFGNAYNNIRIAKDEEWKPAFGIHYGLFEYLVMPFGLTKAQATFQHPINNRPGKSATKPDALSRRPDYKPADHNFTSLSAELNPQNLRAMIDTNRVRVLAITTSRMPTPAEDCYSSTVTLTEMEGSPTVEAGKELRYKTRSVSTNPIEKNFSLREKIMEGVMVDEKLTKLRARGLQVVVYGQPLSTDCDIVGWTIDGLPTFKDRIVVPEYEGARLDILRIRHDSKFFGHPGRDRTFDMLLQFHCNPYGDRGISDGGEWCI
nr:hypothetical protein L204_01327 [Cryptococcus depauperatus CBS 7855]